MARRSGKTTNVLRVGLTVVMALAVTTVKAQEGPSRPPQDYRAGVLSAEFPYESKYIEVLRSKMHHIDQGQGDVFLFLHGNPTSSYLWRNVIRYVAPHGRILFIEELLANATIMRRMSEEEMDVYRAPFLEPESRYPIYMWPNELPVGGTPASNVRVVERIGEWLRTSDTPKLLRECVHLTNSTRRKHRASCNSLGI